MIFEWLNFWRTCFSVSPSMYINPFMFSICPGVILSELSSSFRSNSLGVFDKEFRDCFRCVFSICHKDFACALHQANKHKKSGRAFAYPQARESKPYTHKQEIPPAYHGEHLSVSLCIMQFLDFSLAQKSAKRFFSSICKNTVGLRLHKNNNFPIKMFPI